MTTLALELRNDHDDIVVRQSFDVPVYPRWWTKLLAAMAGSLIWFGLTFLASPGRGARAVWAGLALAALSGVVAYILVTAKLIGLSVDTNGTVGFLALGLLVSGSGAEAVLRKLSSSLDSPAPSVALAKLATDDRVAS